MPGDQGLCLCNKRVKGTDGIPFFCALAQHHSDACKPGRVPTAIEVP